MTAITYYHTHQRKGRALLRGSAALFFDDTFAHRWEKPSKYREPAQWLIRHRGRLVLCQDAMLPVLRLIDDTELVHEGGLL